MALSSRSVHLIGIGGSGMSGLAVLLQRRGARVSGHDRARTPLLARLAQQGIAVHGGDDGAEALPDGTDLVVYSAAIPQDHPLLREARRREIRTARYAEMLGELQADGGGIAVAGTHGKSTTTAWLAYTLRQAGLDPSFIVGAEVDQLGGGSGAGDGPHFVVEACEYQGSFLRLRPEAAVLLNIEEDHLDCYRGIEEIQAAFTEFAALLPAHGLLVYNHDDPRCRRVAGTAPCATQSFGRSPAANWRAGALRCVDGAYEYTILRDGAPLGAVRAGLPGAHNVANALAVAALATEAGAPWPALCGALASFRGARRRLELRDQANGVTIVDDYAHHPTEIRATLRAARERFEPARLWCIFQPHQHSRTRFLLDDFAQSFADADHVVVPDIYFVRDSQRERELVGAGDLVERIRQRGRDAVHVPALGDVASYLQPRLAAGDLVLTMGAGDIWKVADELVERLRGDLPD